MCADGSRRHVCSAEPEPAVEAEEKKEEAETVLSSTFIPRRIMQPREAGKAQIRFAEDIFSNRPNRSEDKPRKKKKRFAHSKGPNPQEADE